MGSSFSSERFAVAVLVGVVLVSAAGAGLPEGVDLEVGPINVQEIVWDDVAAPLQAMLSGRGIARDTFRHYIAHLRVRNQARVREGDLDHLVYYVLQSSSFTDLPPIEPARSAPEFIGGGAVPRAVEARIDAFVAALKNDGGPARLAYFREILEREKPAAEPSRQFVAAQYLRATRFFEQPDYRERGLSTDTSVEAGYVVYLALAALRHLEPQRRIRHVLIVGPGLDLAPRTGLIETSDPQSYQPFAVMDALLGLRLAERSDLRLAAVDINPRVVEWLRRIRGGTPRLAVMSGVRDSDRVRLTDDYREYLETIGGAVGLAEPRGASGSRPPARSIILAAGITNAVEATQADITVDRLDRRFDLVVVTNVFPYLSDVDLLLALTNIARMLAPGGVLLHNEARPLLAEATLALQLPLIHSRSSVIATVEGARSPVYDAIWMHRAPG